MAQSTYLVLGTSTMVLMMVTIIVFVYAFQRKLALKAKAYQEIEKLMQKLELQSAYSLIEGQEQERKRIASELHDNIGGMLATLKMYSDLTVKDSEPANIHRLNARINTLSEDLSQEVRKLSHQLDLRTLAGFGLKTAVLQLCEAIHDSGKLSVTSVIDIYKPVAEQVSLNLYRIIQELFTNTLKHGHANNVRVEITMIEEEITLIYEDDGKGFDTDSPAPTGMGMKNILSRVNIMHGKLTIDSSDRGSTFIIELNEYV